ncbi:MAG: hypothetical protein KGL39_01125 [Patescibacteria group bacterium]|nr:hypothetical protein [Patescibacteria group bacterium]
MIAAATDSCFACGGSHFVKDCPNRVDKKANEASACERCGRGGHDAAKCYAATHADGKPICGKCNMIGHFTASCFTVADVYA